MDTRCSNNYKILIVSIIIVIIFLLLNKNNTQITEQFENLIWFNLPISTRSGSILNRLNNYTTSITEQFENISTTTSYEYKDPFEGFPDKSLSELLTCDSSEWLEGAEETIVEELNEL